MSPLQSILTTYRTKGKVTTGLASADRGKLIMACGTGKTFTSLKIAEKVAGKQFSPHSEAIAA
jgi:predicted helicase